MSAAEPRVTPTFGSQATVSSAAVRVRNNRIMEMLANDGPDRHFLDYGPYVDSDLRRLHPVTSLLGESSLDGLTLRRLNQGSHRRHHPRPDHNGVYWFDAVGLRFNRAAGTVRVLEAYGHENDCVVEVDAAAIAIDRFWEAHSSWERRHPTEALQTEFAYRILILENLRTIDSTVPTFARVIDAFKYWIAPSALELIAKAIDEPRSVSFRIDGFEAVVDPAHDVLLLLDRLNFTRGPEALSLVEARQALAIE